MIDALQLKLLFNKKIMTLLDYISGKGFILTLVGGSVRDYLISGVLGNDLDFELRKELEFIGEDWTNEINNLVDDIGAKFKIKIKFLEFGIFRFEYFGKNFELASPRLEQFDEKRKKLGHKDLKAVLISNLDYELGFKRRDFTINSIAIEFKAKTKSKLIDPLNGIRDLQKQLLSPSGEDFYRDPVRLLRLVRFEIKTGFNLDLDLKDNLGQFNLKHISNYYVLQEAFKSDAVKFFGSFFTYISDYNIELSDDLAEISFLQKSVLSENLSFHNPKEFLLGMVFSEQFTDNEVGKWGEFCFLKKNYLKNAINFRDSLNDLKKVDIKKMVTLVGKKSFYEMHDHRELLILSKFYQAYNRNRDQFNDYLRYMSDVVVKFIEPIQRLFNNKTSQQMNFEDISFAHKKVAEIYYLLCGNNFPPKN